MKVLLVRTRFTIIFTEKAKRAFKEKGVDYNLFKTDLISCRTDPILIKTLEEINVYNCTNNPGVLKIAIVPDIFSKYFRILDDNGAEWITIDWNRYMIDNLPHVNSENLKEWKESIYKAIDLL
jgi:hypothetical protein